jgi:hypothetical protein
MIETKGSLLLSDRLTDRSGEWNDAEITLLYQPGGTPISHVSKVNLGIRYRNPNLPRPDGPISFRSIVPLLPPNNFEVLAKTINQSSWCGFLLAIPEPAYSIFLNPVNYSIESRGLDSIATFILYYYTVRLPFKIGFLTEYKLVKNE